VIGARFELAIGALGGLAKLGLGLLEQLLLGYLIGRVGRLLVQCGAHVVADRMVVAALPQRRFVGIACLGVLALFEQLVAALDVLVGCAKPIPTGQRQHGHRQHRHQTEPPE
jgi:hypothetical protein